jgi:nucleoid-associated protein YgaU
MSGFYQLPPITVRQPQDHDLVDDPVEICGIGTGFEATFAARVRDENGTELAQVSIMAGAMGALGNFRASLPLGGPPATSRGTVEVYESSPKGDGSELNKVVVPVVFGTAILGGYRGFSQYAVQPGDTLSGIAAGAYGDATLWPRLFAANRHQIHDPNLIFPGQVFRVPRD